MREDQLRNKVVGILSKAKPPKSNLSKEEDSSLRDLGKNKDILILPADKSRATVVIGSAKYKTKVNNILSDTKTYEILPNDPTGSYK